MEALQVFNNAEFGKVRTLREGNDVLFAATDVAKALGYTNPQKAIRDHCKDHGCTIRSGVVKTGLKSDGTVYEQIGNIKFITKGNVIRLVANSTLPKAEEFESWIFDELVPTVLEKGGYIATNAEDSPESIMAKALMIADETLKRHQAMINQLHERNRMQSKELKLAAPKVEYYDTALSGEGTYSATDIAKDLGMSAKALNKKLHALGIQYKQHNTWYLYANYQDKGYSKIIPNYITDKNGETINRPSMRWTELGRKFIKELYQKGKI